MLVLPALSVDTNGQSVFLKIFLIEENILSKKLLRYILARKPTRAKNSEITIINKNSFSPISIDSILIHHLLFI